MLLTSLVLAAAWKTLSLGDNQIAYPASFSVRRGPNDDATFRSPDGAVTFYYAVCLAGKTPTPLLLNPGERQTETRQATRKDERTVWRTFGSKDGARSVEAKSWDGGKGWQVFEFAYRTPADLRRHRAEYLRFKRSLVVPGCGGAIPRGRVAGP